MCDLWSLTEEMCQGERDYARDHRCPRQLPLALTVDHSLPFLRVFRRAPIVSPPAGLGLPRVLWNGGTRTGGGL